MSNRYIYEERPLRLLSGWGVWGTTRFPRASCRASSGRPPCGVSSTSFSRRSLPVPQSPLAIVIRTAPHLQGDKSCGISKYGMFPLSPYMARWFGELRDSCGSRSLGETPQRALANEEASQKETRSSTKSVTSCDNVERPHIVWGRGKRVISRTTYAQVIANGNILSMTVLFLMMHVGGFLV